MKVWHSQRELNHLVNMFNNAVAFSDELGAAAMYGCLFDLLSIARKRQENRQDGYRWKRMVVFLEKHLTKIQEQAKDYPVTIQQALVSKIILHREMRKAG